jgi:hypothetical protein
MKIAKVVANPYAVLAIDASDEDAIVGIPQGAVGMPAARNVWLGARLDGVKSARTGKNHFYFPLDRQGKRRVIEIDVSDANVRAHIARAILDGDRLAGVEELFAEIFTQDSPDFAPTDQAVVRPLHTDIVGLREEGLYGLR